MPAYIPPDFLDNTGERTLADALVRLIAEWDQAELDAATGFFEPHVWRYLGEAFPLLTRLRLLLGRPPVVAPQGEVQALDLRRYFRRKLQGDLEALPYNTDYVALVDAAPGLSPARPGAEATPGGFRAGGGSGGARVGGGHRGGAGWVGRVRKTLRVSENP